MEPMPDILRKICRDKRCEVDAVGEDELESLKKKAYAMPPARGFISALREGDDVSIIAEVKKSSPSAGIIREDFNPAAIARAYERGGAACISVLTDEKYFSGKLEYLSEVRRAVALPILRKDFIIDEKQIIQARAYGADGVLLIVAALDNAELSGLLDAARRWGLDALVEVHTEAELKRAVNAHAAAIGINNRDLHTFEVDLSTAEKLAASIPEDTLRIGESGINDRRDIERLKKHAIDAVLVGETLMRAQNIEKATRVLSH